MTVYKTLQEELEIGLHCHNLEHENGNMMVNYRIPA